MDKSLSQYSKENGISYQKAWRLAQQNQIDGAYKSGNGRIMVKSQQAQAQLTIGPSISNINYSVDSVPLYQDSAAERINISALINPAAKYINISQGIVPYQFNAFGKNENYNCGPSLREAIVLSQKAYFNISIVRSVVDIMSEFSVSDIILKGGTKKSRDFFYSWFEKIGLWALQEQFYRELYKTSNVFIWRFDGNVEKEDIKKLETVLETKIKVEKSSIKIPVRYTVLNPADIDVDANLSFENAFFVKVLSDYELSRLRSPRTPEDKEVFQSLPDEIKEKIKLKGNSIVLMPLPADKVSAVFYKKSDYDTMAVPWFFGVLADLEFEMELRNMDQALARACQQVVLLVTMGNEPAKGGINQKIIEATQELFKSNSLSKVLVSDYTTEAKFVTPDISDLLGPEKYEVVQRRIKEGLNSILTSSEEKFANQSTRVSIFLERLKYGRNLFKNTFLVPEMKKVAKILGLKGELPTVQFSDLDLRDELEYRKLYIDLARIGLLTPEETFKAIENGELPDSIESEESQQKFRQMKDKGLYEPITGGPFSQEKVAEMGMEAKMSTAIPKANGRPSGSKRKQSTKKVSPMGTKRAEELYSATKIKDNLILANNLEKNVEKELLKQFKIKELNAEQKEVSSQISNLVIANEAPSNWETKIKDYVKSPTDTNREQVLEINQISSEHQVSHFLASIMYHSKV